ncbi:hypothetical protein DI273_17980 [Streptomyces violascens]|nr:hypothetical protein DI273_17980 [Streptomyces violascens]
MSPRGRNSAYVSPIRAGLNPAGAEAQALTGRRSVRQPEPEGALPSRKGGFRPRRAPRRPSRRAAPPAGASPRRR